MRRAPTYCYLCGSVADTRDHVPPKGIFEGPLPSTLITVPACRACNIAASKDDEYFRWWILTASSENKTAARLIRDKVVRGFKRKPKLLNEIWKGAKPRVDIFSPGGIYLGYRPAFEYDRNRIVGVVRRIIRGLYLSVSGCVLKDGYSVDVELNPEPSEVWLNRIYRLPLRNIGNGAFSFRHVLTGAKESSASVWFLMFYGQKFVVGRTWSDQDETVAMAEKAN